MGSRTYDGGLGELRNDDSRARGVTALGALLRGRKHTKASAIKGRAPGEPDVPFVWVVLSGREKQECMGRACARFDALGIPHELRTYTDLEQELTWQLVAAAMRSPDNRGTDANPFPDLLGEPDEVRDALTVDERDILISEYMDLEELVDPDPMLQPQQWHDDIVHALKKSLDDSDAAASILSNLGSRALLSFLLTTVAPRLASLTGNSDSLHGDGANYMSEPTPREAPTESE